MQNNKTFFAAFLFLMLVAVPGYVRAADISTDAAQDADVAAEMEAAGLYMTAARRGGRALCLCTISDHLYRPEELTPEERQTGFNEMITLALDTAAALA